MITIQFIPYEELAGITTNEKIVKILRVAKENKIVLIQGGLNPEEEATLIERTMQGINKEFKGIEICTVQAKRKNQNINIKTILAKYLIGYNNAITIIGPATIVKEIKKDPHKIELLTKQIRKRRKKK